MQTNKYPKDFHRVIGIDPDIDKNGYAFIEGDVHGITTMTFWELFDNLKAYKKSQLVYIEAGWLNRKIYQTHFKQSATVRERIAKDVGRNHATGQLIESMCQYLKVPYKLIRPVSAKKTHTYFNKLTGYNVKKSNQEVIDAMMLIWGLTTKK